MRHLLPLVALAAACSGKSAAPAPPAEGEVAGVVIELAGAATAQSPGQSKARPLHPGAELVSGDVIATEESASLRARLYHNRAVLVLGGGKMLALRDSPAWKASPAGGSLLEGVAGDDRTEVAGRHAENQGADTSATGRRAMADPVPPVTAPVPQTQPVPVPVPVPVPPPPDDKGGGPSGDDWGTIGETGSLAKDQVHKGMGSIGPAMQACWSKSPPGALTFSYRIRVAVRPDGTVRSVEIDETVGDPAADVTRCVVNAVKKVVFPRSPRGVTFTYPIQFKPG